MTIINIHRFLLRFLSILLGTIFFICLFIYMLLESLSFFLFRRLNASYLYNFRENDLQKLDVSIDSNKANIYLGEIPKPTNEIEILDLSETILHIAKSILLEIRLYPDQTSEAFEIELQIYNEQDKNTIEYVYLFYNLPTNTKMDNFLSAKLWYPITSKQKPNVKTNAIICNDIKKVVFRGAIYLNDWRV